MSIPRWNPPQTPTRQEQFILRRLTGNGKLYAFLRLHRPEIFDDDLQTEWESMYRDTGASAVELALLDLRWQMVLGCLGTTEPVFAQGALVDFRNRLIAADLDRHLLERTVEPSRKTKAFAWRKMPKTLRVALDSSPREGAGCVEDTINLLAHAGRKIIACAARLLDWDEERVCREAGIPLLAESSIKKALDPSLPTGERQRPRWKLP